MEIDCVLGEKSNSDKALLTLVERKTRYAIISEIPSHSVVSITNVLEKIKEFLGSKFSEVFKSITADNGSEFADLSELEEKTKNKTKVYFTHPYSSFETIIFIENWMNTLPRKLLHYKTPEELFEIYLDKIYSL